MPQNYLTQITAGAVMLTVFAGISTTVHAQDPQDQPHTLSVTMETSPTGPNSDFTLDLTLSPADVDVSGFSIVVGYDNAQGNFVAGEDNTAQSAGADYTKGSETPLTGVPDANVYVPLIMTTTADLITPTHLGRLKFHTSAAYSDPEHKFRVYIGDWPRDGSSDAGVTSGFGNGPKSIPTEYESVELAAKISKWVLY